MVLVNSFLEFSHYPLPIFYYSRNRYTVKLHNKLGLPDFPHHHHILRRPPLSSDNDVDTYNTYSHDRYSLWYHRYHNNIHFITISQLIRDLMLTRSVNSTRSQCEMLAAFATHTLRYTCGENVKLDQWCLGYQSSDVVRYYTHTPFFHQILNRILRRSQHHTIHEVRHAIIDLINQLRRPLPSKEDSVLLTLYRGQQMTLFELEKLKISEGEVVRTTSFFSTTFRKSVADAFGECQDGHDPTLISVIFEIQVDTSQPMRPYALVSNNGEEEVLFSPGTKFILMSCRKLHDNGRLWLMKLQAISEQQQEQLKKNHGETFLLFNRAGGDRESVVAVHS